MDKVKEALMGSKREASGQEPVSGKEGEGTATQPFDAGNQEEDTDLSGKAPQHTDPEEPAPAPDTSSTQESIPSQSADSKSDRPVEPSTDATAGNAKSSPKLIKNPTIGSNSWFTNANPFAQQSDDSGASAVPSVDPKATTQHQNQPANTDEITTETDPLPPNHLGSRVPPGQDTIVVEPRGQESYIALDGADLPPNYLGYDVPPGQQNSGQTTPTPRKGKGKAKMADYNNDRPEQSSGETENSSAASNRSELTSTRRGSTGTTNTSWSHSFFNASGASESPIASSSRSASENLPVPTSQGRTITAGGIPLGYKAAQDREVKRLLQSPPPSIQEEQEHEDTTKSNTERNATAGTGLNPYGNPVAKRKEAAATMRSPASHGPQSSAAPATPSGKNKDGEDKVRRRSSVFRSPAAAFNKIKDKFSK